MPGQARRLTRRRAAELMRRHALASVLHHQQRACFGLPCRTPDMSDYPTIDCHDGAPSCVEHNAPVLLGLDWGTTHLRGYAFDDGGQVVFETASDDGVNGLAATTAFAEAVRSIFGDRLATWADVPIIAAGMVGSTRGWVEVPYRPVPVSLDRPPENAVRVAVDGHDLVILPGVIDTGGDRGVMRGEETQLTGIQILDEHEAIVLPGTHSKWVTVADREILGFDTYMTGELFNLLAESSILREHTATAFAGEVSGAEPAFARGVQTALRSGGDLTGIAFGTRSLALAGELTATAARAYLSGLVIGSEFASSRVRTRLSDASGLVVAGSGSLCDLYGTAARLAGWPAARTITDAVQRGLFRAGSQLGLISSAARLGAP